jgi:hypothetical protein
MSQNGQQLNGIGSHHVVKISPTILPPLAPSQRALLRIGARSHSLQHIVCQHLCLTFCFCVREVNLLECPESG